MKTSSCEFQSMSGVAFNRQVEQAKKATTLD